MLGIHIVRFEDHTRKRSRPHGIEPGDQSERGLRALWAKLHPSLIRSHRIIDDEAKPQDLRIELRGRLLIGDRQRDDAYLIDHGEYPCFISLYGYITNRRNDVTSRVENSGDVYQAIADRTRRAMLDRLRGGEQSATQLYQGFDLSQPALSKHLRVLRDAGLVEVRVSGKYRYYRQNPEALVGVADWIAAHQQFWGNRMLALGEHLARKKAAGR